jgi:RNA polymerase sigma-70 factor (ECF subfamily)
MAGHDAVTDLGGPARDFPETSWSVVLRAQDPSAPDASERIERLCRTYWKPVYWFVRRRWNRSNEDAKDLTQEFFSLFLENGVARTASPARGRFRSFLCAALQHFLLNRERDGRRLKRGGGRTVVPLDGPEDAPLFDPPSDDAPPDAAFDRLWARSVLDDGIRAIREQYASAGRASVFQVFEACDLAPGDPPSYADLARRFGLTEDAVRGALRRVRADLRVYIRDRIRATLADPSELDAEIEYLFGDSHA